VVLGEVIPRAEASTVLASKTLTGFTPSGFVHLPRSDSLALVTYGFVVKIRFDHSNPVEIVFGNDRLGFDRSVTKQEGE
jgi:hypothetical protein